MRRLSQSSFLSLLTTVAFIFSLCLTPVMSSCGGGGVVGGDDDDDNDNGEEQETLETPQTATTDSSGTASITSSNVDKEIQITIQNNAGQAISGLNVEYADTSDGSAGQVIVSDPNAVYQTAIITLDSDDLSTSNFVAQTLSGQNLEAFIFTTATLVTIVLVILTAKAVYEIGTGLYELYGDPPTVSLLGSKVYMCISTNQVLTILNIGINAFGLLTAGSISGAASAVTEGTKTAMEVVGSEVAQDAAVTVASSLAGHMSDEMGFDPSKKYCALLVAVANGSERYDSAMDFIGQECSDASECDGQETTAEAEEERDRDQDGYTTEDGDCNDGDPLRYPGQIELCGDGVDQDCDGSDEACAPNITVDISSPAHDEQGCVFTYENGICMGEDRALLVMADVTGTTQSYAYIVVNGKVSKTKIENDVTSTDSPALLQCSTDGLWNSIAVVVEESGSMAYDAIFYGCKLAAPDLQVVLEWDRCDTDVDLYVKEPNGTYRYDGDGHDDFDVFDEPTTEGGRVYGDANNCYGPVYYYILEGAPSGTYEIRAHHKSGGANAVVIMNVLTDGNHDYAYEVMQALGTANAAAGGTANFSSTDASWGTAISISKTTEGYWRSGGL